MARLFPGPRRSRDVVAGEVDDEIGLHLDLRAEQLVRRGLSPEAARAEAARRFGSLDEARRRLHTSAQRREDRVQMIERLDAFWQDLRYAWRGLRRAPGFAAMAVATLALGIGATTAIFSVVHSALLEPLPYAAADRLVFLSDQQDVETPMSYPEFVDWRAQTGVFTGLAAYFQTSLVLTGAGEPEVLSGARVSASLPGLLSVAPHVGRAFRADEDAPGADRVILLGHDLWLRRFGADRGVVGRVLTLNGLPYTVVGVLPAGPGASLPTDLAAGRRVDYWVPLRLDAERAPRGLHFLTVVGRLRPAVDVERARARLADVAAQLKRDDAERHGVQVGPLAARVVGDARPLLVLLLGAVSLVLLVACANVANLLIARGAGRARELAIRAALGAGRRRVVRQLATESLVLALAGGAAGVLLAFGALAALRAAASDAVGLAQLPRLAQARVDGRLLAFALLTSLATGALFGLLPALRASRLALASVLRAGGRGTTGAGARDRTRSALVVAEMTLSFVLLIGAGLLVRSFDRLAAVDKGFDPTQVLTFAVELPSARYPEARQQVAFFERVLERVRALPGVRGASVTVSLPLAGGTNGGFVIAGRPLAPNEGPVAEKRVVGADFFRVLRVPVVLGRAFDGRDVAGAPQVAVVNEAFVRRYFPGENALGRRIEFGWETEGAQEIVGVVGDMREQSLHEPAAPTIYVPFGQRRSDPAMAVVVRTAGDPTRLVAAVRAAVRAVDRDQPVAQVRTLDDVVARALAGRRVAASLFGAFAALALLLAAVGLYAVVSYGVAQRVSEIGVRRALGARTWDVVRLVVGQGVGLLALGAAVGGLASLGAGRLLRGQLYGVGATDPLTFAAVAAALLVTALVATVAPAVRASRVDPLVALREE